MNVRCIGLSSGVTCLGVVYPSWLFKEETYE